MTKEKMAYGVKKGDAFMSPENINKKDCLGTFDVSINNDNINFQDDGLTSGKRN